MTNTVIPQISTLLKARKKLNMGGEDSEGEGSVLSAQALLVNNAMTEANTVLDSKKLTISHDNLSKELQS
jgi:Cu/Ag efflux protein CusF|tara:strand:+ start:398 stop:607 length:210 start_codon:yes stop_codon:yes gene_type:complete